MKVSVSDRKRAHSDRKRRRSSTTSSGHPEAAAGAGRIAGVEPTNASAGVGAEGGSDAEGGSKRGTMASDGSGSREGIKRSRQVGPPAECSPVESAQLGNRDGRSKRPGPLKVQLQGFEDKKAWGKLLTQLGAVISDQLEEICPETILVVNTEPHLKRTIRLCLGLSITRAVVTQSWLAACSAQSSLVDHAAHMLSGTHASQPGAPPWHFNASDSLAHARERKCFYGIGFLLCMPRGKSPSNEELKLLVEAAGGEICTTSAAAKQHPNAFIVSVDETAPSQSELRILKPLELLTCMLRQDHPH